MISREKKLESILVITLGMVVLYLLFKSLVFLVVALVLGVLSLSSDLLLTKIIWAWNRLASFLGYLNGTILLSAVYYLVLCPIAYFYRLRHPDALQLKKKSTGTYFTTRNHTYTAKDLENMW
jgi:Saxitoxin biosynthesis operon protein SxtJ